MNNSFGIQTASTAVTRLSTLRPASRALFALLAAVFLAPVAAAQTVSGEVTDAERTVTFKGAMVSIDELDRATSTDDRGRFRFANVPQGEYTLIISYAGAGDTSLPISVPAAGLDLGEVVIGAGAQVEEVIVYGQSAALAGALNQERSAGNLVSVLDTDAMGQFPDQNVAESLRRLSGVTVENDQGEGRYVVIRGMDPDLNATSINGLRATAAEPRRALQLDVIPSEVLDGLEINKTLQADMDGDAIGGSINVRTLSAFSRKGAYIKARAESSYNEIREEWSPKLSVAGSNIFELDSGRRLGIAGALSWNDRSLQVDNNELDDWEMAPNGSDFTEEFQPRLYTIERERIGGVLNFDLDVSDSTALHLYTLYSRFTDTELRNRLTFALDGLDEATVTATTADYSEVEIERDTKGRDQRGQIAENLSIALGSDTQLDLWQLEFELGYAYGRERTPDQVDGTWVAEFQTGDGIITPGQPALTLNRANPQIPIVESQFWTAFQDATLFELDALENFRETNEDTQFSVRFDATRDTGFGNLKFGLKARLREKKTNEDADIWSGDGATWFLSDVVLPNGGAAYGFPTPMDPVPDNRLERDILDGQVGIDFEDIDSEIDSNVADFVFDEDVYSGYLMANWETSRTLINAGVRVEHTELDNRGNLVEFIEEDANGPGDPPADVVIVAPISATNSYTDVLPSVNLRFEFNESLIGRASVFRSVVRPRVEEVALRIDIEDNEGALGNPDLDPFRAWNIDASIAYYPTELSVISAGVFYKNIEDFVFVQTIDDFVFLTRTLDEAEIALNGEDADVFGAEINYQQHFGFLSPPFDGFLIGLNYTYVDSEADTGDRKVALPKQSANIANAVFGYEKHGLDLRIALKYRDRYIDSLEDPGLDRYTDDHLQWDLTARYRFSDSWMIYAEIANLNGEPEYYYAGDRRRALQYDDIGMTSAIGFQYNFQE